MKLCKGPGVSHLRLSACGVTRPVPTGKLGSRFDSELSYSGERENSYLITRRRDVNSSLTVLLFGSQTIEREYVRIVT